MALYEIFTIEEYCKKEGISDSGARKRVKQKNVKSAIIDEELHILIPSDLKQKIALKNKTIQALRQFKKNASSEADKIERLENEIKELHREHKADLIEVHREHSKDMVASLQGSIAIHNENKKLRG